MKRYALCGEDRCYRDMRKVLYSRVYDNDIRIVDNVLFKSKEWRQINLINRFAFNERLLTFFIANMIIKFVFKVENFLTMIARGFVAYSYLIII